MSLAAYFWMGRVGRIPEIPRIFNGENDPHKRDASNRHNRDASNQRTSVAGNQRTSVAGNQRWRNARNQHKSVARKVSNGLNRGQAAVGNFEKARSNHA